MKDEQYEEYVVRPVPSGPVAPPAPVVRAAPHAARHDGRDGTTPSRADGEPTMPRPAEYPSDDGGGEERGGLHVVTGREGATRVVTVTGELDLDTGDVLRRALAVPADEEPEDEGLERIVVDLSGLRFCDSTGLNILLRTRLDAEAAGLRMELAGPRPVVARVFALTGVDGVLRIHPDLGAALRAPRPVADAPPPDGD
ncbi:STAS domain-containing protein [Kitasatospora sp. NPDC056181]|uniref:STAS domain-containing protein n=1 Tax=Kitasatospora sp. NPDC056181 TaxID=3345737 RepID=UPI0035DCB2E4